VAAVEQTLRSSEWFERVQWRIAWLTLGIGVIAACVVALAGFGRWGIGILLGAVLAWVNFRWFEQAIGAVARVASAQAGAPRPRVSMWIWVKFFGRYGLIAVLLYTAWAIFRIPVVSMLAGLCALGAAVTAESVYEIFKRAN
jgi:hypothetical protein